MKKTKKPTPKRKARTVCPPRLLDEPAGRGLPHEYTPKRKGVYYCSPRCGGGHYCLWSDYLTAKLRAKRLAMRLSKHFGVSFTPVLNENLGWHYSAELHSDGYVLTVSGSHFGDEKPSYYTLLGSSAGSGDPRWSDLPRYADPCRAVAAQLRKTELVIMRDLEDFQLLTVGLTF